MSLWYRVFVYVVFVCLCVVWRVCVWFSAVCAWCLCVWCEIPECSLCAPPPPVCVWGGGGAACLGVFYTDEVPLPSFDRRTSSRMADKTSVSIRERRIMLAPVPRSEQRTVGVHSRNNSTSRFVIKLASAVVISRRLAPI